MNVVRVGEWTWPWRLKHAEGSLAPFPVAVPHLCHDPVCDKADWLEQHAPHLSFSIRGLEMDAQRLWREWEQPRRRRTAAWGVGIERVGSWMSAGTGAATGGH